MTQHQDLAIHAAACAKQKDWDGYFDFRTELFRSGASADEVRAMLDRAGLPPEQQLPKRQNALTQCT